MTVTDVYDCTGSNYPAVARNHPGVILAGYDTGWAGVPWPAAYWQAHPDAIHIDQDPAGTDYTADILDVEAGAATLADVARWKHAADAARAANRRTGQRIPGIYCSRSSVTPVVNALISGGVTSCPLWIAAWGVTRDHAAAEITANAATTPNPFPIIGRQYADQGMYDANVMLTSWLTNRSAPPHEGPYRHVTDGKTTLAGIVKTRNTTAAHILSVSASAYTAADQQAIADLVLPAGYVYYTSNP